MSYYDHATAMSLKLDRWKDKDRRLRNFEIEALESRRQEEQEVAKKAVKKKFTEQL